MAGGGVEALVEKYIFTLISAIIVFAVSFVLLYLNSQSFNSKTFQMTTIFLSIGVWGLLQWINYTELTAGAVLKIVMTIVMMISVYQLILFEMADMYCPKRVSLWQMIVGLFR